MTDFPDPPAWVPRPFPTPTTGEMSAAYDCIPVIDRPFRIEGKIAEMPYYTDMNLYCRNCGAMK